MRSMSAIIETLNLRSIFTVGFWYAGAAGEESSSGINWATIIFIAGMMIMVEGMAKAGFFRWLCMRLAKLVHYKPIPLFVAFMIMSSILAMFIDSITVILFLAAVTVELAKLLKFDPIPMNLVRDFLCKPWRIGYHVWRSTKYHHRYFLRIFFLRFLNEYRCYGRNQFSHCYHLLFLYIEKIVTGRSRSCRSINCTGSKRCDHK